MRNLRIDFVGRRRIWFTASAIVFVVASVAMLLRGFNLSIEFTGGSSFTVSGIAQEVTAAELEAAAQEAGATRPTAQLTRTGDEVAGAIVRTDQIPPGSEDEQAVVAALQEATGAETVEPAFVGPTFGERISRKMLQALAVFLVVVTIYISIRLEFKMAMMALVALVHDLVATAGVYALFQFPVSPATVIALLTILGYSLYDTIIVFDRLQEETVNLGAPGRRTYSQTVNTSQNEVLWRSLNTGVSSVLPVAALLFIGSQALGAATLEEIALALFVGMLLGAYSSLFIAGPGLAMWREREPEMVQLRERAAMRKGKDEDGESGGAAESRHRDRRRLEPTDYVRGRGRTPRSRRR